MNDSSTGGYLTPSVASPPLEDAELDALIQQMVVGITGLPGNMVRPRWQPVVPKQPEPSVNWCAIGVTTQDSDAGPAIVHQADFVGNVVLADGTQVAESSGPVGYGDINGRDTYIRHQDIEVLASFYGPNGKRYAQQLSDGLAIPQNREQLGVNDMAFVDAGAIRAVPEMVNQQWIRRYDMTVRLRRKITRTYAVLNLLSADVQTTTDGSKPVTGSIST